MRHTSSVPGKILYIKEVMMGDEKMKIPILSKELNKKDQERYLCYFFFKFIEFLKKEKKNNLIK